MSLRRSAAAGVRFARCRGVNLTCRHLPLDRRAVKRPCQGRSHSAAAEGHGASASRQKTKHRLVEQALLILVSKKALGGITPAAHARQLAESVKVNPDSRSDRY